MRRRGSDRREGRPLRSRQWLATTLLVLASSGLSSCRANEPWSFTVTRTVYGGGAPDFDFSSGSCNNDGAEAAAAVILAILLLPVAIDLVVLPIALTHDLCDLE